MTCPTTTLPAAEADLAAVSIRDLVEIMPVALETPDPLGIALCRGGAHPLGEELELHGGERAAVMPRTVELAAAQTRQCRG